MKTIKLNQTWRLGDALAEGGFGMVFEAEGSDGVAAVVKLIPKFPGAARELLFEELSGLPNIVPILDSGEWEEAYALVMPRAEKSLRQHQEEAGGKLPGEEAVTVLSDIAEALASLHPGVVHRDLKPENVLLYQGHWCIADFGIARYAEATTEPDTRKYAMTPAYAAPEQWRSERATTATDIYAFGVIAFELLQGDLPFPGPDLREQHLKQPAPELSDYPAPLAALVAECLLKPPAGRPSPSNILARLRHSQRAPSPASARLQAINRQVVEKRGREAAQMSASQSREEIRRELFVGSQQSFGRIVKALQDRVLEDAPSADVSTTGGALEVRLGNGVLTIDTLKMAPADCLAAFDYHPPFDVVAYSSIIARKPRDPYDYEGRAHSLWYCDAHEEGAYRWFELAFMVHPGIAERYTIDPFSLPPTDDEAAKALTPTMTVRQVAWQPIPIDQGEEDTFIERWLGWFAAAADGSLSHPRTMPENSGGSFRPPRRRQQ